MKNKSNRKQKTKNRKPPLLHKIDLVVHMILGLSKYNLLVSLSKSEHLETEHGSVAILAQGFWIKYWRKPDAMSDCFDPALKKVIDGLSDEKLLCLSRMVRVECSRWLVPGASFLVLGVWGLTFAPMFFDRHGISTVYPNWTISALPKPNAVLVCGAARGSPASSIPPSALRSVCWWASVSPMLASLH